MLDEEVKFLQQEHESKMKDDFKNLDKSDGKLRLASKDL